VHVLVNSRGYVYLGKGNMVCQVGECVGVGDLAEEFWASVESVRARTCCGIMAYLITAPASENSTA
jgi:hypothetical protein